MLQHHKSGRSRRAFVLAAAMAMIAALVVGCSDTDKLLRIGDPCIKDDQCQAGLCDDQVCVPRVRAELDDNCRHRLECRSGVCIFTEMVGRCGPGVRPDGERCTDNLQCAEGSCVDGVCVGAAHAYGVLVDAGGRSFLTEHDALRVTFSVVPRLRRPPAGQVLDISTTLSFFNVDGELVPSAQLIYGGQLTLGGLTLVPDPVARGAGVVAISITADGEPVDTIGDTELAMRYDADQPVHLAGESLQLPPGWSASLLRDFSNDFQYLSEDFLDGSDVESNAPSHVAATLAPFAPGFAVLAGRQILELPEGKPLVEHNYTPPSPNSDGPDGPTDLTFHSLDSDGYLLVASASLTLGDGLYQVGSDWTMKNLATTNNCEAAAVDPDGAFEGAIGLGPKIYFASENGIARLGEPFFTTAWATDFAFVPSGELAGSFRGEADDYQYLGWIDPVSHSARQARGVSGSRIMVVNGGLEAAPGFAYVVRDERELLEVFADGSFRILARSTSQDWRWRDAVVPPAGHPRAGPGPTFVILESNRVLDVDRLIVLRGS